MALFESVQGSHTRPSARVVGAAWGTAALHLAVAAVLVFIASRPPVIDQQQKSASRPLPELIWLHQPGPSGGRDDGGDRSSKPAPRAQRPGTERITVPVRVSPSLTSTQNSEPPSQEISIPAVPQASGLRDVPGVLTTVAVAEGPRGPGSGRNAGDGSGPGFDRGVGGTFGGGPPGSGSGATPPELIWQVKPSYTPAAMQARLRGLVVMEAVVLADGSVGDVKIIRSLDATFGLDHEAVKAVRQWRFRPAMRRGQAMPMLVSIELLFELR